MAAVGRRCGLRRPFDGVLQELQFGDDAHHGVRPEVPVSRTADPPDVGPAPDTGSVHAAVCLGMSACAQQPATTQAQDVHTLYYVILALAAAVFIGVEGTLLWSVVRYRRRKGDQSEPPQREGTTRMIVVFFVIGAVLVG